MDINEFQTEALKSVAVKGKGVDALAHRSLGLAGEAGEVANCIKKIVRDRNSEPSSEDIAFLKEKLGDTMYYLAILSEYFVLKLSDIAQSNLQKSANFKAKRKI